MKTKRILVLLFSLVGIIANGQKNDNFEWLKSGTVLSYHVVFNAIEYDFVVDSIKLAADVSFAWNMTEPMTMNGSIVLKKNALDTATTFYNYFSGGNLTFEDKTSVWISKKVFKAIKKGSSIIVDAGTGREKLLYASTENISVKIDGHQKSLETLKAVTESGKIFWILNNPANPIIVKMNLGWSIILKEVK